MTRRSLFVLLCLALPLVVALGALEQEPPAASRASSSTETPTMIQSAPAIVPADWPHRQASRSVVVGELAWHVQVMGQGPTVVLLHGTGASAHSWEEIMPRLAEVATVVAPDLPGHGYTRGARVEELNLPRMAADLQALVEALGVAPPRLIVGHSAGAPLAVRWVLDAGLSETAILGFNPSLVPPPPSYDWVAPWLNPIATSSPVASLLAAIGGPTGLVNQMLSSTGTELPPARRAYYRRLFSDPAHVRGAMGFMAAANLPALLEAGRTLRAPATWVVGAADAWIPEPRLREVIGRYFPSATVLRWEGGHLLHEVEPERAAELVREVLARALGDAGGAHAPGVQQEAR